MLNVKPRYIFVISVFCFLLFGCKTTNNVDDKNQNTNQNRGVKNNFAHKKYQTTANDAAPKGPVPSSFKENKPVDEPLSRYGNPAEYNVDGKTYQVMTRPKGYHERGLASWYGTKFHSRSTSSGEAYNMYALTAAHKTLPLPSYVRVKNLNNGRTAIIKVNDRGPFHTGRVLDLSYGSAVKLGIFPKGTAMVEIEAITQKDIVANYYLQVGAFASNTSALNLQSKIQKYSSNKVFIEKDKQKYLVRVGPIVSRSSSDNLKKLLQSKGVSEIFTTIQ
jgi:rare lipoprotein A